MDGLMSRLEEDIFIGSIDDRVCINCNGQNYYTRFRMTPGYRFFRVRAVDYESTAIQKNADELFHVPLSKRAYSNNERFSLVGFPSLYLSTMLPLAWQECGYPQKYYYSKYQYKYSVDINSGKRSLENELKFLLLYSPDEIAIWGTSVKYNNFALWLEVVTRYLKAYPLILACSFVNQSGKVPYKQEYIIPQMLMQWVQRNSHDTLIKMINICGCLMSLLENQNAVDMQLVLHVLNSLSENISSIKRMQLDRDIETEMKKDKDIKFIDESDLSDTCTSFKKIYYNFVSNSSSSECIEQIVRKHKDLCWNDS